MLQSHKVSRPADDRAFIAGLLMFVLPSLPVPLFAEQERQSSRQIEEMMVTAEKRQTSVQDTSLSITAFDGDFLADFGIRNQEDLANYIPATTIQPYDMAIRGIGRSFRSLGGDPGIATYYDGVYSEDFGIASTEGGLYDIERIEVLRGPQGTLYGRNAVGGAINFISKNPSDEFEGELKTHVGTFGFFELYGLASGPLIDDFLTFRATAINRNRDGYYEDLGSSGPAGNRQRNPDVGDYGDENYTLTLELTPFENFSWRLRGNERSYRRRMGGAGQTAGIIAVSESGQTSRDADNEIFGFRRILSSNDDMRVTGFDETAGASALSGYTGLNTDAAQNTLSNYLDPQAQLHKFTNPYTQETVLAQRLRPGIDSAIDDEPSRNFRCRSEDGCEIAPAVGTNGLKGKDLKTATNALQDEFFDHQATYSNMEWALNESLTLKYVFGYTDYFYDRTTDRDLTSNVNADETFYVSQENENFQHEFQFLFDFDKVTLTSGVYIYEARITQRGDFYSASAENRYAQPVQYGTSPSGLPNAAILGAVFPIDPDLFSARASFQSMDPAAQAGLVNNTTITSVVGLWRGDNAERDGGCTNIPAGPQTCGTFLEYQTENQTEAFAFYNQLEFFATDELSLTMGLRYAEDKRSGEENVLLYTEAQPGTASGLGQAVTALATPTGNTISTGPFTGLPQSALNPILPVTNTASLSQFNQATGALDANLQQTGDEITRYRGVPFVVSFYRPVQQTYDAWTWRINLDWEPNDHTLVYAGVTTGYRAGGFNLNNLSQIPVYPQEEVTAYEIGWKDQLFDRSLQINTSIYLYDYENVHQQFNGFSSELATNVGNVLAVPSAEVYGLEGEAIWLATERLTLGGNFSYTHSQYTSELLNADGQSLVLDDFNAAVPSSLFSGDSDPSGSDQRRVSIEGNQMLLVPEIKWTLYGIYEISLGNRGSLELRSNLSFTDEVFFSIENNPADKASEYYRWDARMTWTSPEESVVISGFVNNIMDEIGIRQINRYVENQNYLRAATVTDPRLMGLELTYRFGAYR